LRASFTGKWGDIRADNSRMCDAVGGGIYPDAGGALPITHTDLLLAPSYTQLDI